MIVSRGTEAKFDIYVMLLKKWQKAVNLVGPSTLDSIRERHINDSLQLAQYLPNKSLNIIDFGSGAGFPGMVLAMVNPPWVITLIESDQKKCSFLKTVSRETNVPVNIVQERIENYTSPEPLDFITARALAPLKDLIRYALPYATRNPCLQMLFLKGNAYKHEVEEAESMFNFKKEIFKSESSSHSAVLKLSDVCIKNGH